jgi:hypothetical protein
MDAPLSDSNEYGTPLTPQQIDKEAEEFADLTMTIFQ